MLISRCKVYNIMRYITDNLMELPYDVHDLEDKGLQQILLEMGIFECLTEFEEQLLYRELYRRIRHAQTTEIARTWVMAEC